MSSKNADPLPLLLNVLADRHIDLTKDDVAWAFQSTQTKEAISSYVTEYLTTATLLSPEELQVYEGTLLNRAGELTDDPNHKGSSPNDHDFTTALNTLEESTLALEEQCKTLEAQKAALSDLISVTDDSLVNIAQDQVMSRDRHHVSRSGMVAGLESRVTDMSLLLDQEWRKTKDTNRILSGTVKYQLDLDDQLLERLQHSMGLSTSVDDDAGIPSKSKVENFCNRLSYLRSQALKNEVNHVYLQALEDATTNTDSESDNTQVDPAALSAISLELDTLMVEVDSVLQMVIEHEHKRIIMNEMRAVARQIEIARIEQDDHVLASLAHMTDRLSLMSEFVEAGQAQSAAFHAINQAASQIRATIDSRTDKATKATDMTSKQGSVADTHCLESLFRRLDIRNPERFEEPQLKQVLHSTLSESTISLARLRKSTEDALSQQSKSAVVSADKDLQHLTDALFAYTSFRTPQLSAETLKRELQDLDRRATAAGRDMGSLESGRIAAQVKNRMEEILTSC